MMLALAIILTVLTAIAGSTIGGLIVAGAIEKRIRTIVASRKNTHTIPPP